LKEKNKKRKISVRVDDVMNLMMS